MSDRYISASTFSTLIYRCHTCNFTKSKGTSYSKVRFFKESSSFILDKQELQRRGLTFSSSVIFKTCRHTQKIQEKKINVSLCSPKYYLPLNYNSFYKYLSICDISRPFKFFSSKVKKTFKSKFLP